MTDRCSSAVTLIPVQALCSEPRRAQLHASTAPADIAATLSVPAHSHFNCQVQKKQKIDRSINRGILPDLAVRAN